MVLTTGSTSPVARTARRTAIKYFGTCRSNKIKKHHERKNQVHPEPHPQSHRIHPSSPRQFQERKRQQGK